MPLQTRTTNVRTRPSRFWSAEGGATVVEFALVVWPFLLLCLGMLQFLFLNYTQSTLSDALYGIASQPATLAVPGTQADYKTGICAKNTFTTNCTGNLKVERWILANLPTATTAIGNSTWQGASGDIVVLRAVLPTQTIVGFMPAMNAAESVTYRLP